MKGCTSASFHFTSMQFVKDMFSFLLLVVYQLKETERQVSASYQIFNHSHLHWIILHFISDMNDSV